MKVPGFCLVTVVALLTGCASMMEPMGAAVDSDKNVLTGGPISGTTIRDLPQSVRSSLRQYAPEAEIADIDRTTRSGEVVFEISFTQPSKNPKIVISEAGRVLSDSYTQIAR